MKKRPLTKKLLALAMGIVVMLSMVPLTASAEADVLTLGTPLTVVVSNMAQSTFTPAKDGLYTICLKPVESSAESHPQITMKSGDEPVDYVAEKSSDAANGNIQYIAYWLSAGVTYTQEYVEHGPSTDGFTVTAAYVEAEAMTLNEAKASVAGKYLSFLTFTPEEDGEYMFVSSVTGNEGDPYLWEVLDEDGYSVPCFAGDPDDYTDWQFRAAYELEADVTYTLILSDYDEMDTGFFVTANPYYDFLKTPTVAEPSVEVNKADQVTSYAWYTWKEQAAAPLTPDSDIVDSYNEYDEAKWKGWEMAALENGQYEFGVLDVRLAAGDKLTIKATDPIVEAHLGAWQSGIATIEGKKIDNNTVMLESLEDQYYSIVVTTVGNTGTFEVSHAAMKKGDAIQGQTTDTLTAYEKNAWYSCEVTYKDGYKLVSPLIKMLPIITQQPTAAAPSVKVSFPDDVKTYQWYKVNAELTPLTPDDVTEYASYDEETGKWTAEPGMMGDELFDYYLFTIDLEAGDTVYVQSEDVIFADYSHAYDEQQSYSILPESLGTHLAAYTAEEDGQYRFYVSTNDDESTFTVSTGSVAMGDAIEKQTDAALTDCEKDAWYACKVTYKDGVELLSDYVQITAAITKQPTATAPTVEINLPAEIKGYQWMNAVKTPITDKNASIFKYDEDEQDVNSEYNSEKDIWTPVFEWIDGADFGIAAYLEKARLKAGDVIYVQLLEEEAEAFFLQIDETGVELRKVEGTEDRFMAEISDDGEYTLFAVTQKNAAPLCRVWLQEYKPVDGQTAATLTKREVGTEYHCEVTLKDNTVLVSNSFTATDAGELAIKVEAVDTSDKAALESALKEIEELLKAEDLTDEDKELLTGLYEKVKAAIAALAQKNDGQGGGSGNNDTQKDDAAKPISPNTGENSTVLLWLAVMISGGLVLSLDLNKKKGTCR